MNERIKELAEQALEYTETQSKFIDVNSITREKASDWWDEIYNKKFAELIIGHATECVRDVLRDEDSELTYAAATQVQNRIKECFGVEE
jgi:hypothetical protein